jgi:hypothetical protein
MLAPQRPLKTQVADLRALKTLDQWMHASVTKVVIGESAVAAAPVFKSAGSWGDPPNI